MMGMNKYYNQTATVPHVSKMCSYGLGRQQIITAHSYIRLSKKLSTIILSKLEQTYTYQLYKLYINDEAIHMTMC